MGTVYKEFVVNADPQFVWEAIRDVGALHKRLARGFIADVVLTDSVRTITFSNGYVAREQVVTIDNDHRRLVCAAIAGRASHHNSSFQVFDGFDGNARVLWITDVLPEEVLADFEQMAEAGVRAIKLTLEKNYTSIESLEAF
jgi:hypothetical protein